MHTACGAQRQVDVVQRGGGAEHDVRERLGGEAICRCEQRVTLRKESIEAVMTLRIGPRGKSVSICADRADSRIRRLAAVGKSLCQRDQAPLPVLFLWRCDVGAVMNYCKKREAEIR